MPEPARLVEVTRGRLVECVHFGALAIADAEGRLVFRLGDADAVVFGRSALKPFQALPAVASGVPEAFGFDAADVALWCASHSGEPLHVERVRRMLARIGCGEADLRCGMHPPLCPAGAPGPFSQLHHNCSGKHAGFLAWCRHHGQPLESYLEPDHPLQLAIREAIRASAGVASLEPATDGCSAPAYALPLAALARAYARLALAHPGEPLGRIFHAMTAHPYLVSGARRADEFFMRAGGGDVVAKGGADGVHAFGVRSRGIGVALKIWDGNARAAQAAASAVLRQLGVLGAADAAELREWLTPEVRNARGIVTGGVQPVFALGI